MNKQSRVGLAVAFLLSSWSAHAAFTTWTLSGIKINYGTSATGFFTYDPTLPIPVGTFDIKVTDGPNVSAFEYTPGNSTLANITGSTQAFTSPGVGPIPGLDDYRLINFFTFGIAGFLPAQPLPGDAVSLLSVFEGWPTTNRSVGGGIGQPGQLIASIPEASTYALFAVGLGMLMFLRKRSC